MIYLLVLQVRVRYKYAPTVLARISLFDRKNNIIMNFSCLSNFRRLLDRMVDVIKLNV